MTEKDWINIINFLSDSYTIALLICVLFSYLVAKLFFKKAKEDIFIFGAIILVLFAGFKLITSYLILPAFEKDPATVVAQNMAEKLKTQDQAKLPAKPVEQSSSIKPETIKVSSKSATLSIKKAPSPTRETAESLKGIQPTAGQEVTLEIPLYRYLKETHPEYYQNFIEQHSNLLEKSTNARQSYNKKLTQTALKKLPASSNKSIVLYTNLVLEQIDEILEKDKGALCYRILYPEIVGLIDGRHIFSTKVQENELKIFTRLLTEEKPQLPRSSMLRAMTAIDPILQNLAKRYKIDKEKVGNPRQSGMPPNKACKMTKTLFTQVLKLPKKKSLESLRWIYTLNHL